MPDTNIPTTNRPDAATPVKPTPPAKKVSMLEDAGFKAKMDELSEFIKEEYKTCTADAVKVEQSKLSLWWNIGTKVQELAGQLSTKDERMTMLKKLEASTGMNQNYIGQAVTFRGTFTQEQFEKAQSNGLSVRSAKAIMTQKDPARRQALLDKAITDGLTAEEIRGLANTKGSRKAAGESRSKDNDSKKPPVRVFSKCNDTLHKISTMLGSSSDAIGRLSKCKSEEERKKAVSTLLDIRKKIPSLAKEFEKFMKFTEGFEGKK